VSLLRAVTLSSLVLHKSMSDGVVFISVTGIRTCLLNSFTGRRALCIRSYNNYAGSKSCMLYNWATVCKTVRPMLSVCLSCRVCPVCLSVTLVCCGQTVGRIKMKLGMQVGLGLGHIVLDGDPGPTPPMGHTPLCGSYLLWPNGSMDQDASWYGGKPRPRPHCARSGPNSPSSKRGHSPQLCGPYLLCPNGWMDQDATRYDCRPRPGNIVLMRTQLYPKGHSPPKFRPMSVVAKRLPIWPLLSTCASLLHVIGEVEDIARSVQDEHRK